MQLKTIDMRGCDFVSLRGAQIFFVVLRVSHLRFFLCQSRENKILFKILLVSGVNVFAPKANRMDRWRLIPPLPTLLLPPMKMNVVKTCSLANYKVKTKA
jgi:hypothetical protein